MMEGAGFRVLGCIFWVTYNTAIKLIYGAHGLDLGQPRANWVGFEP